MSLEAEVASAPAPAPAADPAPPVISTPSPAVDKPAETPEAAEAALDKDLRNVWRNANKERDEAGKFASKEPKKAEPPAPALDKPADDKTAKDAKPADLAAEKPAQATAVEPPRSWTAEQKAKWAAIPADVQPLIAEREAELHEVKSDAGRMAAQLKPLAQVFGDHKEYLGSALKATNKSLPEFINDAIAASAMLDRNPAEGLKAIAKMYGVDLGALYDPLAQPPDPTVTALQNEVAQLRNRLVQEDQQRAAYAENQQAARKQEFNTIAAEFMAAHPDAKGMEPDIIAEISAIQSYEPTLDPKATLKKAFERAQWANEKTRSQRLKAEIEAANKQSAEAAKAASLTAQRAASVNVRGSARSGEAEDLEADLRGIWRKNATR